MIDVKTVKVSLPLKTTFAVSKGGTDEKTNLLAILNNRYAGEAASSVYYGPTVEQIHRDLKRGIANLKRRKKLDFAALEAINRYKINAIARSALMAMVVNYLSGESGRYPWEILSLGTPVGIKNSITISIDEPNEVIASIRASDFPIVKVKMGGDHDSELLKKLKSIDNKEIRVDANGGWSCERAEEMIFYLHRLGVCIIEQPTDEQHVHDWPHLKGKTEGVELIQDEGLNTIEDYRKYSEFFDGVNIKMEKSGGILEAIRIAREARQDNKKVMLGCMVQSSVGIAQSVYMSSLADYHDLDAPQLLVDDIAAGIIYDRDTIHVDREIIGGPSLKRDVLEKYIKD